MLKSFARVYLNIKPKFVNPAVNIKQFPIETEAVKLVNFLSH